MTPALDAPVPAPSRRSFVFPIVVALLFALGAVTTLAFFGVIDIGDHPFARQRYGGFRR